MHNFDLATATFVVLFITLIIKLIEMNNKKK